MTLTGSIDSIVGMTHMEIKDSLARTTVTKSIERIKRLTIFESTMTMILFGAEVILTLIKIPHFLSYLHDRSIKR